MKLALAAALCLFLLLAQPLAAQAPDSKLTFEVASVKPTGEVVPGRMLAPLGGPGTDDPGRISWPRTTLFTMMGEAYDVTGDQITGLNWLNAPGAPFYAVDATIPPGTTKEQFRLMLQNLLADRFHLKLHHETQIRPGPYMGSLGNPAAGTLRTTYRGSPADFCGSWSERSPASRNRQDRLDRSVRVHPGIRLHGAGDARSDAPRRQRGDARRKRPCRSCSEFLQGIREARPQAGEGQGRAGGCADRG